MSEIDEIKKSNKFLKLLIILLLLSSIIAFFRYIVFNDFMYYTDENTIPTSPLEQTKDVIEKGL